MHKLSVKLEGIERRKKNTWLFHVAAGFFLTASAATYYQTTGKADLLVLAPLYLIAFASLVYGFFRKKLDPAARFNGPLRLIQAAAFFGLTLLLLNDVNGIRTASLALWALVSVFLFFTEKRIFHQSDLQIKAEGLFIPGYFRHHLIPWQLVESLVLRTDFLTITRKDQKFVQLELLKDVAPEKISEINSFCAHQIQKSGQPV